MLLTDANFTCDIDVVVIEKRPLSLDRNAKLFRSHDYCKLPSNHPGEKKVDQNTEIKKAAKC